MNNNIKFLLILFVFFISISGCQEKSKLLKGLEEKCRNKSESVILMRNLVNFKWDKIGIFQVGVDRRKIDLFLGYKYKGETDLTRIVIFVYQGKIVYEDREFYNPEQPSRVFFNMEQSSIELNPNNALFRVIREKILKSNCYELLLIKSEDPAK